MDDAEFQRIKSTLIQQLIVAGVRGSKLLESWQYAFVEKVKDSDGVDAFQKAFDLFVESRIQSAKGFWGAIFAYATRMYVCALCKAHIKKGEICLKRGRVTEGGAIYCIVCALVLIRTRMSETEKIMEDLKFLLETPANAK